MERYTELTKESLDDFIKLLTTQVEPRREYVMMTGLSGMFLFDFAMRGINLPKGVKYTWIKFKKLPDILYINIGKRHDNTKIRVDMYDKVYTAMNGTIKLGSYDNIEMAVEALKLN